MTNLEPLESPQANNRDYSQPFRWSDRRILGFIPIILSVSIALFLARSHGSQLIFEDERDYMAISRNVVGHAFYSIDGTTPTAFRQPGWPMAMSLVLLLGGGVKACRFFSVFIYGASLLVGKKVAEECFGSIGGSAFAWLSLLYPVLAYTAGTLFPQSLATLLLVLGLLLSLRLNTSIPANLLRGLVLGALCLTVSTFVIPGILVVFYPVIMNGKKGWMPALIAGLAMCIALAPWLVRNAIVMGEPTMSTNLGINLALGNSSASGPNTGVNGLPAGFRPPVGLSEVQSDHWYRNAAVSWVESNPSRAASLYVLKFLNYFGYKLDLRTSNNAGTGHASEAVLCVSYYSIVLLAILSFFRKSLTEATRLRIFLCVLYVTFGLASAVFFTRVRFRTPMDLVLILLASGAVVAVLGASNRKNGLDGTLPAP